MASTTATATATARLVAALQPLWSESPDPLGPRVAADAGATVNPPALASALAGFLRAGPAAAGVPDEHLWNVMYGLVVCQDESVLRMDTDFAMNILNAQALQEGEVPRMDSDLATHLLHAQALEEGEAGRRRGIRK